MWPVILLATTSVFRGAFIHRAVERWRTSRDATVTQEEKCFLTTPLNKEVLIKGLTN